MRSIKFAVMAIIVYVSAASAALSTPMPPDLQQQLLALQAGYGKAMGSADFKTAFAMMSADTRKSVEGHLKTPEQRNGMAERARSTTPDSIEVIHAELSANGNVAKIEVLATLKLDRNALKQMPKPPADGIAQSEVTYTFVKENGEWKYDMASYGPDPRTIKACNPAWEGLEAYDRKRDVSLGGMIRRVSFERDHILVVIRILNEEGCLFLPPRAALEKLGFNPARLAPRAIVSADTSPHKTDKSRFWIEGLDVKP